MENRFETKEAATVAGRKAVEEWGSNLVYLGWREAQHEGQPYYYNAFNVWE